MKNRFNNITSKEWLPFQKSWFAYLGNEKLYSEHIRFFIKYDDPEFKPNLFYSGYDLRTMSRVCKTNSARLVSADDPIQYALIDLREEIEKINSLDEYKIIKEKTLDLARRLFASLKERRFISIIIRNRILKNVYYPFAWDLAYSAASVFSLKDEKIGCFNDNGRTETFYVLNFRKDENSKNNLDIPETKLLNEQKEITDESKIFPDEWEIIKPPPRKKKEILHPAKFPENLIKKFIEFYSNEGDNIFDPMSGTGSTQLAALQTGRNGYGAELSKFFADIATERLNEFMNPKQNSLFPEEKKNVVYKIVNKDARNIDGKDFPLINYIITSPPYWDMLNMKGAENQAKRKEKGLQVNYSDDNNDLGNIDDYNEFISELTEIYFKFIELLKPGGCITIIVKNIKKKGKNYPFAWDITAKLSERLILLPEFFWLQDDINLAPYGYGNTFVSNTFHQYCLTFMKPAD